MKNFIRSLFIFFLVNFSYVYTEEESSEINQEEIVHLESNFFLKPPISPKELEMPSPVLKSLPKKNPFIAVGLSSLIPGLGHTYLGDLKTAGSLFGSTGLLYSLAVVSALKNERALAFSSVITLQNTWFYNIYAAYRDTRQYNTHVNYSYKMPKESFMDLGLAPFNLSILKKPEVWGALVGAIALGSVISYYGFHQSGSHIYTSISTKNIKPLAAFPVGLGEETFFRGYLQSALSETFSPWTGITISSLIFGAMHISNAQVLPSEERWRYYSFSLPFITTFGVYFGWLTYKNHSLKESVALHTWYDFILFLAGSLATPSILNKHPNFAVSFSF